MHMRRVIRSVVQHASPNLGNDLVTICLPGPIYRLWNRAFFTDTDNDDKNYGA
jgi:hypothetical protein